MNIEVYLIGLIATYLVKTNTTKSIGIITFFKCTCLMSREVTKN